LARPLSLCHCYESSISLMSCTNSLTAPSVHLFSSTSQTAPMQALQGALRLKG